MILEPRILKHRVDKPGRFRGNDNKDDDHKKQTSAEKGVAKKIDSDALQPLFHHGAFSCFS